MDDQLMTINRKLTGGSDRSVRSVLFLLSLLLIHAPLDAQTPFYKDKTIRLVAGTPAGSLYDLYARMGEELEKLGKEIIAQPRDVIERMKKLLGT